ncbi:1-acyl-sn-glycerol-3-phosphate acyltransferase [Sulfurimonas sp. SWIR-19]|uniref:lysophospholipid acyltransferase family protein n=1 Tax=Sulfurimonas sp. SWIR-19 TaxID=2878390 RepID=UPI001CF417DF|nr:lysophospholipid acyltransferase family protein [Sulfurimonas sp. SWIR-19]UCM99357.1 1-acyl-sn-glycerol-3-phosphate acyltransferase [Sulfurimonas sp. SWIR-19]
MLKDLGKFIFMIELGFKYIKIFKQTYFHPFITQKYAYQELSKARQEYSNKVLDFLNIKVKLVGELPKKDKILYAINHRSLLDILVMENIFSRYNKSGTWIAKQELFEDPIYGRFFQYSGCIPVDLENKKGLVRFFKTIKRTLAKVDDLNIYIFPEGERYNGEGIKQFQSGASKIAKANNLDIVPVYINDKLEKVFKNAPYNEPYTVEVHVGGIINYENLEEKYLEFYKSVKEKTKGNK